MNTQNILDIEFVVVEPPTTAPIVQRPKAPINDEILTPESARTRLAQLLRYPLPSVHIIDRVGRVYLLQYQPIKKKDPDIIYCTWPSARPINMTILTIQEARSYNWPNWYDWWNSIDDYITDLKTVLHNSTATGAERAFVLEWAYKVRDTGATTTPPRPDHADYY